MWAAVPRDCLCSTLLWRKQLASKAAPCLSQAVCPCVKALSGVQTPISNFLVYISHHILSSVPSRTSLLMYLERVHHYIEERAFSVCLWPTVNQLQTATVKCTGLSY